jgi:hypothetical protein
MIRFSNKRAVLVHYHLFKNAGTSIERLLRDAFGDAWQSWDKTEPGARISGAEAQAWLESHPKVRAVSSHQIVPPQPVGDFDVIPIVFLREPLSRVRSAWLFEWQRQPGLSQPKGSLTDYIEEKFKQKHSSVIADFQVSRLGHTDYEDVRQRSHREHQELLPAACDFLASLPFIGLVDRFTESLELMQSAVSRNFPDMVVREHRENVLQPSRYSIEEKIEQLRHDIGNEMFDELCVRNSLDLQLYSYATERFETMMTAHRESGGRSSCVA